MMVILNIPNVLTLLRFALVPLFIFLFFSGNPYLRVLATFVFIVAAFTDLFDGYYARKRKEVSKFGRFADPLADKCLALSAFFLLVIRIKSPILLWLVIVIAVREILITGLRLYAIHRERSIATSLLAKWKTVIQLFSIIFALVYLNVVKDLKVNFSFLTLSNFDYLIEIFVFLAMTLAVISAAQYLKAHVKLGAKAL
ncbi:CDP-diacylglycerol--glycerol-3-phosphate 3-phosphatidyltransferase [candidate division KSB1 bacterium]|nr:CDP-diacylglycerol--glycerol-3-phosphate 3-phosphatidyltransferase [candidate division KSB1 bacterium]